MTIWQMVKVFVCKQATGFKATWASRYYFTQNGRIQTQHLVAAELQKPW